MLTRKQVWQFIGAVLLFSWASQSLILLFVGDIDSQRARPFLAIVMFMPGIVGAFFCYRYEAIRKGVQWRPKRPLIILLAAILPIGLAFITIAFVSILQIGHSDYFEFSINTVSIQTGSWILGTGTQSWLFFVLNVTATALVYSFVTSFVTVGEEFGWRGVLQGAIIHHYGFLRGVALLGTIWAAWHIPIILAGYNYPNTPVLGAFVFLPLLLIAASYVLAWLTLWSGSFWPAVVMHGCINSVYDSMVSRITLDEPSNYFLDITEIVVFGVLAFVVARGTASLIPKQRMKES